MLPQTAHGAECVLQRLIQIRYMDYSMQGCQEIRDFEVGVVLLSGIVSLGSWCVHKQLQRETLEWDMESNPAKRCRKPKTAYRESMMNLLHHVHLTSSPLIFASPFSNPQSKWHGRKLTLKHSILMWLLDLALKQRMARIYAIFRPQRKSPPLQAQCHCDECGLVHVAGGRLMK